MPLHCRFSEDFENSRRVWVVSFVIKEENIILTFETLRTVTPIRRLTPYELNEGVGPAWPGLSRPVAVHVVRVSRAPADQEDAT